LTPHPGGSGRRGATLAELVVALGLAALLYALGGVALLTVERRQREGSASGAGRRAVREAITLLGEELRGVDSLTLRGDTAVDLLATVGTSVLCARTTDAVVLPPAAAESGLPFSSWRAEADVADVVALFDADAKRWWYAAADSVAVAPAGACPSASGLVSARDSANRLGSVRLRLDRLLPAAVAVGAPVRVLRRGRYLIHRGADGGWGLAYRRCTAAGCAAAQPVTGPLAPASEGGLSFALSSDSSLLAVAVRAPRRASGAPGDSLRVAMAVVRAP
jgi:hypothetical protein